MKKAILLFAAITAFNYVNGQSCCTKNTDQSFPQLAMSNGFASAHLDPIPYSDEKPKGENITFPTEDQIAGNAYVKMASTPTNNWVFVYHEWWGLNDYIRSESDKIQKSISNCNVIAIDLYDGRVANEAALAQQYSSKLDDARVRSIIKGALSFVGDDVKIVNLGWCMGGGWSLQSTWIEEKRAVGCVMYYGLPETDLEKIKKMPCDILGIFATEDKFITKQLVTKFQENLNDAGIKNTIKFYEADHAFANPSNPKHNVKASNSAFELVKTYIKEKFNN